MSYAALLLAGDTVHDRISDVIRHAVEPGQAEERQAAWRAPADALRVVDRTTRTAGVVGPAKVGSAGIAMREALYNLVAVWRDPASPPADRHAVNHADTNQKWEESTIAYLTLVEEVTQTFD